MNDRLIDTHVHVWNPSVLRYEWLDGEPALNRPFLPGDLDRGSSGVTDMVFVQADPRADQGLDEARWVASLAPEWPELAGIVAFAPIEEGAGVADHLSALREVPLVVGIRRLLQGRPDEFLADADGSLAAGLRAVGEAGLPFDACVTHDQLPALAALLERAPDTTVVLDHLGKPPLVGSLTDAAALPRWRRDLERLAENPRVHVKLSGLAPEADPGHPFADQARPWIDAALEVFGTGRALLGSDWPVSAVTPHAVRYDEWFALVLERVRGVGAGVSGAGAAAAEAAGVGAGAGAGAGAGDAAGVGAGDAAGAGAGAGDAGATGSGAADTGVSGVGATGSGAAEARADVAWRTAARVYGLDRPGSA